MKVQIRFECSCAGTLSTARIKIIIILLIAMLAWVINGVPIAHMLTGTT